MKNSGSHKILRYLLFGVVGFFALTGLVLTMGFFAVKFHLTDDPGVVDINDRYFQDIKDKYGRSDSEDDSEKVNFNEARLFHNLSVLSRYYPANAYYIQNAYFKSHNLKEAQRMIQAVNLHLQDNAEYHAQVAQFVENSDSKQLQTKTKSVFEWMNISEWQDFKLAVGRPAHGCGAPTDCGGFGGRTNPAVQFKSGSLQKMDWAFENPLGRNHLLAGSDRDQSSHGPKD